MNNLRLTLLQIYRLAKPYFIGDEKRIAIGLLVLIVSLRLFNVWLDVRYNRWNNDFYNSLQNQDWKAFWHQLILVFSWIATLTIVTTVSQIYFVQWLQIRWRGWMTESFLRRWMHAGTHYRMRLLGNPADNPDQRIAEDTARFVGAGSASGLLDIGISLLGQSVTLVSFLFILWNLSVSTPLVIFGKNYNIPGYLVWAALIYSIIGTTLTHWLGKPLVSLNFEQQRLEGDFRFSLVRLRERAEEVALLHGEQTERERLRERFAFIVGNWYRIMSRQKNLTLLTAGYTQVAIIFPFMVVSPLYFSRAIELGGLMQIAQAFGTVQTALSFFVTAYTSLADFKSVVNRLIGFDTSIQAIEKLEKAGPALVAEPARTDFAVEGLSVRLPDGREIVHATDLEFHRAEHVLVTGPTGSGKTSLFRALGGLWPYGSGAIRVPERARVLVLPQRAYIPLGTLRAALTYPAGEDAFLASDVVDALRAVGLGRLVEHLGEEHDWQNQLSGGEQQRIGLARALVQKPDWLFLDEATSNLDEPSEAAIYRLLAERLPNTAVVSIGHRSSLIEHHTRFLTLKTGPDASHVVVLVPRAAAS